MPPSQAEDASYEGRCRQLSLTIRYTGESGILVLVHGSHCVEILAPRSPPTIRCSCSPWVGRAVPNSTHSSFDIVSNGLDAQSESFGSKSVGDVEV